MMMRIYPLRHATSFKKITASLQHQWPLPHIASLLQHLTNNLSLPSSIQTRTGILLRREAIDSL
jgi:hypothetical protein